MEKYFYLFYQGITNRRKKMIKELFSHTSYNKKIILKQIDACFNETKPDKITKWKNINYYERKRTKTFLATDGSVNYTNLKIGKIYVLRSQSIYSPINEGISTHSKNTEVGFIPSTLDKTDLILSKQMNILELKSMLSSLHSIENVDYLLIDGDLHSIITHIARGVNTNLRRNEYIVDLTNKIKNRENSNHNAKVPTITSIIEEIPENLDLDISDIILYYQMIEQLCIIKNLLEKFSEKIISISKTSHSNSIFNNKYLSDSVLLEKHCKTAGFYDSDPNNNKDLIFRHYVNGITIMDTYPVYDDFFRKLTVTTRFSKLIDSGAVLKVQVFYETNEQQFVNILKNLQETIVGFEGYPYILKRVDNEVRITSKDITTVLKILGLNYNKRERDVL